MIKNDNPAGRLYLLLENVRSQVQNVPVHQAWAQAFGVKDDEGEILILLAEVIKLMSEVKSLVAKQDVDQALYLKPFAKIQRVFALSLGHQVSNIKEYLDDATMVGLEHCAELLSRKTNEKTIDGEVLAKLQADIDVLIEKVLQATLPDNLQTLLLDSLHYLRQAVLNYRIHGAKGIEGAIKTALGSIQYYTIHSQTEEAKKETDKQVVRDFISLLEQLLSIVANALNVGQLVSGVTTRLLGP